MNLATALMNWVAPSTYTCSPESHALLYSIIASSVMISLAGVYVWRRFIRTQPDKVACESGALAARNAGFFGVLVKLG